MAGQEGVKALNKTRGIHCLSSFEGRVNEWAHLRRPGCLLRIGEERVENMVGVVNNRRKQPVFCRINKSRALKVEHCVGLPLVNLSAYCGARLLTCNIFVRDAI